MLDLARFMCLLFSSILTWALVGVVSRALRDDSLELSVYEPLSELLKKGYKGDYIGGLL